MHHHPVKAELKRRGLTITGFAPEVGLTEGSLRGVLNGAHRPWPALIRRISEKLELPAEELFGVDQVNADQR
jgi:lambda repressor-like predicted transcriptional regulator